MTARVRFAANKRSDGLLIPLTAIFQQGKDAAVWIVAADRTISLRPVQVAAYRDDGAVITGGLMAGERIVKPTGCTGSRPGKKSASSRAAARNEGTESFRLGRWRTGRWCCS